MIDYPAHLSIAAVTAALVVEEYPSIEVVVRKASYGPDLLVNGRGPHGIAVSFSLGGVVHGEYFAADVLARAKPDGRLYQNRLERVVRMLVADVVNGKINA
jgi:hypothetical protein